MNAREMQESPLTQGADERIAWSFDGSSWGTVPFINLTVTVFDISDERSATDVTSTVAEGDASVTDAGIITTKRIVNLTVGNDYRVEIQFTDADNNVYEPFFRLKCR